MTIQESVDDILARLKHALLQRERAAREWERQSKQWELRWRDVTGERDAAQQKAAELEAWRDQPERARKITQLVETIVRLEAQARVSSSDLAALQAQLEETQRERDELLALIGTETPIAAFDLATTWRTEKAGYMEEVGALEPRVATLRAALSALLVGAEQQSQSHADVAALCRAALGEDRL